MIKAVGVVIPAHDEEDLLPSCLAAVRRAARMLTTASVQLVVVADACDDRTAELARHGAATVVEIRDRNVVRLPPHQRETSARTVWLMCHSSRICD